jgi:hypothetical protein
MTAQETKLLNAFETTLNATAGASDLTFTVSAVIDAASNTLTAPCYLVLNPDSATNREVILITSINPGTKTLTCDNINKRYLTGSAATSGLSHSSGAVVRVSPVQQHIEDINDRVDTIINEAGTAVNTSLFLDEDDMVSDSATKGVTQQSVKAYVDTNLTAQDLDLADGDGNTGAVDLDSQSLTLQGTANESTVALSGQTYTIGLPSSITVDVTGNLTGDVTGNVTGQVSDISNHSTTDLSEGTNLYYTSTRANTDIDARVTKSFVDALNVDADTLDGNDSTAFATSAQGALADSAIQPTDGVGDLSDVDTTGVSDGQVLVYNNAASQFEPGSVGSATALIDGDSDFTLTDGIANGIHYELDNTDMADWNQAGIALTTAGGIFTHHQTQAATYTIATDTGSVMAGPITITGTVTNNGTLVVI